MKRDRRKDIVRGIFSEYYYHLDKAEEMDRKILHIRNRYGSIGAVRFDRDAHGTPISHDEKMIRMIDEIEECEIVARSSRQKAAVIRSRFHFDEIDQIDMNMIECIYRHGMSFESAGEKNGYSRITTFRHIGAILEQLEIYL